MNFHRSIRGAAPLALTFLAFPALAQDEIVLKDGHQLVMGKVDSSTPDGVTFTHDVDGKPETVKIAASDLDSHNFYIIRKHAIAPDDAAAHYELGQYCLKNGLNTRARNQFIAAARIDPAYQKKASADFHQARTNSGADLLAQAQKELAAGDSDVAYRTASMVVRAYGDTPAAVEARKLIGEIHEKRRSARSARPREASGNAALGTVQEFLQHASELNKKGLTAQSTSAGRKDFEQAAREYQRALERLKDLPGISDDKRTKLMQSATQDAIEAYINAGHSLMVQTDFQGALKEANKALALDPKSSSALAFRAQVSQASADSGLDWGGRVRGRRR